MEQRTLRDLSTPRDQFNRALECHSQVPGRFFLAQLLGLQVSYDAEHCFVDFVAHEYLQNPRGTLQGGVLATALDVAMGHLVQHLHGPAATVDINVQFHRTTSGGRVRCDAGVVHRGTKLWFMNAAARTESGELIASASATFTLLRT